MNMTKVSVFSGVNGIQIPVLLTNITESEKDINISKDMTGILGYRKSEAHE